MIAEHGGVDIIEVSGGTYESPAFVGNIREAVFASFSRQCRSAVSDHSRPPVILLTGGFKSRSSMRLALQDGSADLIGIARAAAVDPTLASRVLNAELSDAAATCCSYNPRGVRWLQRLSPAKVVGFGWSTCILYFFWSSVSDRRSQSGIHCRCFAWLTEKNRTSTSDWSRDSHRSWLGARRPSSSRRQLFDDYSWSRLAA
jgi:hypothetical protein